ncbi:DUF1835 domain-containing protein [Paenibacillus sp. HN-1]|uniref:DUF1835 domain-containing protein n=1 Tax=Paenibacillus TaxID=44249 RepID=UPI001CAA371A|nr:MULTISPECIES: DUF1835 domain-containing protein [Paenibacillus]MBY9081939.1 DUF1835 domain-containing protein [Paenibacillus sp. CGMCC 1.18879]MBY9085903.1 DUF1835 domain-containing protein [Paenibacillus sinensis]
MLHIVNGDAVSDKLLEGGIEGKVLAWREIYSAGPLASDLSVPEALELRAHVLEKTIGIPAETFKSNCAEQESRLEEFHRYSDIVLWFEHDLFDQSMLSYLLHWFSRRNLGETRLHLLSIGEYPGIEPFHGLGQLTVSQLMSLDRTWRPIGVRELRLGSRLWEAYTSANPIDLARLLEHNREELREAGLPFAYAAFKAHLSRLPSLKNGLGIAELETLRALRQGASTPLDLFRRVTDRLSILGMGDLEYWHVLSGLAKEPHALLVIGGTESEVEAGEAGGPAKLTGFTGWQVILTELGERVLDNRADRVKKQGIDEWYGGIHIEGHQAAWRWDSEKEMPVAGSERLE